MKSKPQDMRQWWSQVFAGMSDAELLPYVEIATTKTTHDGGLAGQEARKEWERRQQKRQAEKRNN